MSYKIPLGKWCNIFVDFLNDKVGWLFDIFSISMESLILGFVFLLNFPSPYLLILFVSALFYFVHRNIKVTLLAASCLFLILNQGYWEEAMETLALVIVSTVTCVFFGTPIGILAAKKTIFYSVIRPIMDMMQTIPTFVYLIPALILFGLGVVPGLVSTVIFAIPAIVRLTYLGVHNVPKELVDAGESFGANRWELLRKIEIPYAMPSILLGITQTILLSLSMVVISALVGADGLGKPVVRALNSVNIEQGFEAGFSIVLLAILLDRFLKHQPEQN